MEGEGYKKGPVLKGFCMVILGSFSNDDGDGNENATKQ